MSDRDSRRINRRQLVKIGAAAAVAPWLTSLTAACAPNAGQTNVEPTPPPLPKNLAIAYDSLNEQALDPAATINTSHEWLALLYDFVLGVDAKGALST